MNAGNHGNFLGLFPRKRGPRHGLEPVFAAVQSSQFLARSAQIQFRCRAGLRHCTLTIAIALGLSAHPAAAESERVLSQAAPPGATQLAGAMTSAPGGPSPNTRPASVKDDRVFEYPVDQVWPTTVRLLRLDRGYLVTERDREAGYIMFEAESVDARGQIKKLAGSIEMVELAIAGRPRVRVYVTTRGGPSHLPFAILDGIGHKLRGEYGRPQPAPPPNRPPTSPPDDRVPTK